MPRPTAPPETQNSPSEPDPVVSPPARTDAVSDGLEQKPIKIFRGGENAGADDRSTAAATRT